MRNYESYKEPSSDVWLGDDGWYGCTHGIEFGNAWESDDVGPFNTKEEAEEEMRQMLDGHKEKQKECL